MSEGIQEHAWKCDKARMQFETSQELNRPFMWLRPKLYLDGDMWCALLGENLQEGVAAFGKSPSLASYAFDKAWYEEKISTVSRTLAADTREDWKAENSTPKAEVTPRVENPMLLPELPEDCKLESVSTTSFATRQEIGRNYYASIIKYNGKRNQINQNFYGYGNTPREAVLAADQP